MIVRQPIDILEQNRIKLQIELDAGKIQAERNSLGQFATPTPLALDILQYAKTILPDDMELRFLDPAIGTGAFYSALTTVFPRQHIAEALGFEIDPYYGNPAATLWKNSGLKIKITDFTHESPSPRFNIVICNPPYVRHHHLENGYKLRLQTRTKEASGIKISGLAGLYCHFLGLSHAWMADGGIAGWLIPSEFMDVNYGKAVKHYLLSKVTLLHIHRFDPNDVQFADALVSSAVVWFRKSLPPKSHSVMFSFGGTLLKPNIKRHIPVKNLLEEAKWTRFPNSGVRSNGAVPTLSDFFQIKRGIATGDNSFFILDAEQIASRNLPMEVFRPILPSPRYLPGYEILSDKRGLPLLEHRLFLLDIRFPEDEIGYRFAMLSSYLQYGKSLGIHERYICRHRTPWYSQENRPPAPIVCTYMGRGDSKSGRPFRFILNKSKATVANVYLAMYPTPLLKRAIDSDSNLIHQIWEVLNQIAPERLLGEGRVYGGGLHKLEPKELSNVDATAIAKLIPSFKLNPKGRQLSLFDDHEDLSFNNKLQPMTG
jgi:adenine-specific DNA-methyltransferase